MEAKKKQILFAVIMGLVAVTTTYLYIQKATKKNASDELVKVAVLSQAVQGGSQLHPGIFTGRSVPKSAAPTSVIPYSEIDSYIGETFSSSQLKGDYIQRTSFAPRRLVANSLSAGITGNQARGVTIPVSETSSLAGSIVPGDAVDILYTFDVPSTSEHMTTLLLQNIPVIATGTYSPDEQEFDPTSSAHYSTITLLLNLNDAVRIKSAQRLGTIDMLLRSRGDAETATFQPIGGYKDILSETDKVRYDEIVSQSHPAVTPGSSSPVDEAFIKRLKELGAVKERN